ncbi:MAG: SAM-dependent methyltransferase [Clostridiales bacterium]|nr:SAM-dependent methyltransferase [Clostridiales bacterium]
MTELSARLKAIADRIPACNSLVDVGTDHVYIPIYAVGSSICKTAVASDVRKGPVAVAERNVTASGLGEHISVRLGNGLEGVVPEECEVIVIAGMGGLQISEILGKSPDCAKAARLLILQPMSDLESARKWLYENGFRIMKEALIEDEGKIYNIIDCIWDGQITDYDDFSCYIGDVLVKSSDPLLMPYLTRKLKQVERIIEGRQKSTRSVEKARISLRSDLNWVYIKDRLKEIIDNKDRMKEIIENNEGEKI